jgi:hypothetical protein
VKEEDMAEHVVLIVGGADRWWGDTIEVHRTAHPAERRS